MATYDSLEAAVVGDKKDLRTEQLLKRMRREVGVMDEEAIRAEFDKIDKNQDGQINFKEFQAYVRATFRDSFTQADIEAVFNKFADKRNEVDFEKFLACITEEHLNRDKIREKFEAYLRQPGRSIEGLFDQFAEKRQGRSPNLTQKSFQRLLEHVGFKFDDEMVDRLFEAIAGKSKNIIEIADLREYITDQNLKQIDLPSVYRKLRR